MFAGPVTFWCRQRAIGRVGELDAGLGQTESCEAAERDAERPKGMDCSCSLCG